jgi:hypothetical protein
VAQKLFSLFADISVHQFMIKLLIRNGKQGIDSVLHALERSRSGRSRSRFSGVLDMFSSLTAGANFLNSCDFWATMSPAW